MSLFFYYFTSGTFIILYHMEMLLLQQTRTHIIFTFVCFTKIFINSKEKHILCVTVAGITKAFGIVIHGKY